MIMSVALRAIVVVLTISVLLITLPLCEAKRYKSNNKLGGGYSTRRQPSTSVTKPTYNTHSSSSDSHIDAAKLSYPNYNSPPNRPASAPSSNSQPIGWNVPNQSPAGPPPAYSASNVAGGAKTNIHEPPPVYQKPNFGAAPPSYNQATGTNYGAAPQYHSPQSVPAGATYYNNPSQVPGGYPAGAYPAGGYGGGGYHAPTNMQAGATYYPSSHSLPQGATYIPAGNSLPPGAVLYSSPPQQTSSGLGFGSGLAAGAIGGAILGHVLTPTHTKVVEQAPAPAASSGSDGPHVIIINNGQPVNATDGVTVVNNGAPTAPSAAAENSTPASLAPMAPIPVSSTDASQNSTNTADTSAAIAPPPVTAEGNAAPVNPEQPPAPGGIICVPVRVNETDPTDATKVMEVEKIACFPAPPPQPQVDMANANNGTASVAAVAGTSADGSVPLAPMQPITAVSSSQQVQQESAMIGDQSMKSAENVGTKKAGSISIILCFILSYSITFN